MSSIDKKSLRRLLPALEALKERDAALLREKTAALNAIEAETAKIEAAIVAAAQDLEPGDFASEAAYLRYREVATGHIESMRPRREALEKERDAARDVLARSFGKLRGVETLLERPDPPRRGV